MRALLLLFNPVRQVLGNLIFGFTTVAGAAMLLLIGKGSSVDTEEVDSKARNLMCTIGGIGLGSVLPGVLPWWSYFILCGAVWIWEDLVEGFVSRIETWIYLNIRWVKEVPELRKLCEPIEMFLTALALTSIFRSLL